jgi:hypothetical protein
VAYVGELYDVRIHRNLSSEIHQVHLHLDFLSHLELKGCSSISSLFLSSRLMNDETVYVFDALRGFKDSC